MANRRGEILRDKINNTINKLAEKEYGINFLMREEQALINTQDKNLSNNSYQLRRNIQQRQERQLDKEKLYNSRQQLELAIEAHQRARVFQRQRMHS